MSKYCHGRETKQVPLEECRRRALQWWQWANFRGVGDSENLKEPLRLGCGVIYLYIYILAKVAMIISLSWMYIDFQKPKRSKLKPINLSGVSDSNVRLLLFSKLSSDCTLRILLIAP